MNTEVYFPSFVFGLSEVCTYCGQEAVLFDHVVPLSLYLNRPRKRREENNGIRTYSCRRCNALLYNFYFASFKERLLYVQQKLITKAQQFNRAALWTDEEISELDPTLRSFVAAKQKQIRELDSSVVWLETASFKQIIKTLQSVPYLQKSHPKYRENLEKYFNLNL